MEATDWFETQTQEVIDWLVLSKARGIDDENLPADAASLEMKTDYFIHKH